MFVTTILIIVLEYTVLKAISFKIISTILFVGSFITCFWTYLINPGVTFKEKNIENGKAHHCVHCSFTYPKNESEYQHCFACGVCIPNVDHHCGVFGKCIGYRNKIAFYLCPTFSIILLILCFVSVLYHFVSETGKKKEKDRKI